MSSVYICVLFFIESAELLVFKVILLKSFTLPQVAAEAPFRRSATTLCQDKNILSLTLLFSSCAALLP